MDINNIKIGMHVIPTTSTHPGGDTLDELYHGRYGRGLMYKGYMIVCDIDANGASYMSKSIPTIWCHPEGRKESWGHGAAYSWLPFTPEDLEPITNNSKALAKYLQNG
jgi:hypothetical protein